MNEQEQQQRETARIERVRAQLEHLLNDFRLDYVEHQLKELQREIATPGTPSDKIMELMAKYKEAQAIRNKLARSLGNSIIV